MEQAKIQEKIDHRNLSKRQATKSPAPSIIKVDEWFESSFDQAE
jgi:hypothetical protein